MLADPQLGGRAPGVQDMCPGYAVPASLMETPICIWRAPGVLPVI